MIELIILSALTVGGYLFIKRGGILSRWMNKILEKKIKGY